MIYAKNIEVLLKKKRLTQSQLSRLMSLSRQTVSRWFVHKSSNIESGNLVKLSSVLQVSTEYFTHPFALLNDPELYKDYETQYLWDRLFPSLEEFIVALVREDFRAVSRLVQVAGFFEAHKAVGNVVWKHFHGYKKYIKPKRREDLEKLWNILQGPLLS